MDAGDISARLETLRMRDAKVGSTAGMQTAGYRPSSGEADGEYTFPDKPAYLSEFPDLRPPALRTRRWALAIDRRIERAIRYLSGGRLKRRARVEMVGPFTVFVPRCCLLNEVVRVTLTGLTDPESPDFLYGDSIHYSAEGHASVVALRPEWSPERLRNHCYVGDVIAASHGVVKRAGGTRMLRRLGSHDRALRLSENAGHPAHVHQVMYAGHRQSRQSEADLAAVSAHCERTGIDAVCSGGESSGTARVARRAPASSICAVIPTRGTRAEIWGEERTLIVEAVRSLLENRGVHNLEIVVVHDAGTDADVLEQVRHIGGDRVSLVRFEGEFNFAAKTNLGAAHTDAEYLMFVNDDTQIESPDVLDVLVGYLQDPGVGLVAPLLRFEDGSVQSAGHMLNPMPFDLYRGYPVGCTGGDNLLGVAREVSSVIAAFTMTRRSDFDRVGGLCELFPRDYNDVDYALKLRSIGLRTLFTPHARCWHFESKTRVPGMEPGAVSILGARWREQIECDPFGNRLLQPYEFIWKADFDNQWALEDALGHPAAWDGDEWRRLQEGDDRHLHRTMFFPSKVLPC